MVVSRSFNKFVKNKLHCLRSSLWAIGHWAGQIVLWITHATCSRPRSSSQICLIEPLSNRKNLPKSVWQENFAFSESVLQDNWRIWADLQYLLCRMNLSILIYCWSNFQTFPTRQILLYDLTLPLCAGVLSSAKGDILLTADIRPPKSDL